MVGEVVYVDSSALVKLVIREPESAALLAYLAEHPVQATSMIARVEVARAFARAGVAHPTRLSEVFDRVVQLAIDPSIVEVAASLMPPSLRSLDALHLSTALSLGEDLGAIVTYDTRLAHAAAPQGIAVATPR